MSVLQGYIRLLQRNREDGHPEAPMLAAMLEATGRLATIGRQASDFGLWLGKQTPETSLPAVPLSDVFQEIERRLPQRGAALSVETPRDSEVQLHAEVPMLAEAIVALAETAARDAGAGITIAGTGSDPDGQVTISIRSSQPDRDERPAAPADARRRVAFERGGAGLALITASYVLDAHGAVTTFADAPGSIDVRLPKDGGPQ